MTFHEFITLQIQEINRHKWIESQKAGYDLGDRAIFDWVEKHADAFRRYIVRTLGETVQVPNDAQPESVKPDTNHMPMRPCCSS